MNKVYEIFVTTNEGRSRILYAFGTGGKFRFKEDCLICKNMPIFYTEEQAIY